MKGKVSGVGAYSLEHQSALRAMLSLVEDYKRHPERFPKPLVNFGGGWPGEAPPDVLRRVACERLSDPSFFDKSAKYGETRGERDFFKAIANYENEVYGREVPQDELIVGNGSTDLTSSFLVSTLDLESEVIITRPGYLNYKREAMAETQLKAKVTYWNTINEGRFEPRVDELRELISDRTRMIIITTPGNPDSQVFNDQQLEALVDVAEDKGVWVMIDMTYRAFCYSFFPNYYTRKRRPNEIWMCTLSKEFRIPGWRIAYAQADKELVDAVMAVEQARNMCPSRLVQEILTPIMMSKECIDEIIEFNRQGREKYRRMGETVSAGLREHAPRMHILEPMGGFFVFPDITNYTNDSADVVRGLVQEEQTLVTDGGDFGLPGWFRLSFAPLINDRDTVIEGVRRIGRYLEERYPSLR